MMARTSKGYLKRSFIVICSDCSAGQNAGDVSAQGTCPTGYLCQADGSCVGKLCVIYIMYYIQLYEN